MEYEKEVTVPANTLEADPVLDELILDKGVLSGYVYFPLGCIHLVKVRIYHGEFKIAPWNPDGWLMGEGARVPFADNYDFTDPPYTLKIRAASPGTVKQHKPLIHASVIPKWLARPEEVLSGQLSQTRKTLEGIGEVELELLERMQRLTPV
jgi:hypothetical protein